MVLAILGILAAAGMARWGRDLIKNVGAETDARRIALDLHQARRRAISTGSNHLVRFNPSVGAATSFTVYRRSGMSVTAVEATRDVPAGVTVTPSHADAEFTFEGTSLAAYSITVAGPSKSFTVSVVTATGAIRVVQNP